MNKCSFVAAAQILLACLSQAAIVYTPEAAGVQSSTVAGIKTIEDFNSLPLGSLGAYVSPVGNYSMGARIVDANPFGGANQTRYATVGKESKTTSYFLDFGEDLTYFGIYWPAVDPGNELRFFDNGVQIAAFRLADIVAGLPVLTKNDYYGEPSNKKVNNEEPYVFANFTATGGTVFDKVEFHNDTITDTAFESDNHTIIAAEPRIPKIPEPSTYLMVGAGIAALALKIRR